MLITELNKQRKYDIMRCWAAGVVLDELETKNRTSFNTLATGTHKDYNVEIDALIDDMQNFITKERIK